MFITGPDIIKSVTGEEVILEQPGGVDAHMDKVGDIDFVTDGDEQAVLITQELLNFLSQNNTEEPSVINPVFDAEPDPEFHDIVPVGGKKGYDTREVVIRIVNNGDFLGCQVGFTIDLVVGFGRVSGHTVGFVANQPDVMPGMLDTSSSNKDVKFIHFRDAFNVPLVVLIDAPGFMPGVAQGHDGVIRHDAKTFYVYPATSMPKAVAVMCKAYDSTHLAMCLKDLGTGYVFTWPTAEITVADTGDMVDMVFRKEIVAAGGREERAHVHDERITEYKTCFSTPYIATSRELVDDVIDLAETRLYMANALSVLYNKHGICPIKEYRLKPQ